MRCPDCGGRKLRRRNIYQKNQRSRNPRRIIGPRGRGHWLRNPLKPKDYETRLNKLRKLGLSEEHLNRLSDFNTEYNDATQANYIIDWWLATIALQNDNKKYLLKYTRKYHITDLEKELRMENYVALLHFAQMAHSHSKFWVKWPSIPPSQLIESLKEQEAYKTFIIEARRKLPSAEGENVRWKMERKEEILAKDLRDAKNKAKEKGFDTSWEAISDGRTSVKEKRAKFYRPEHHNVLLRFDGGYEWVLMHPDDRRKEGRSLDTCATPESGGVLVSLRKRKGDSDFYQSLAQFVIHFSKDAWDAVGAGARIHGHGSPGDQRYTFLDSEKLFYLSANDPQFRGCGIIGEGRGTSNHKPLERYHPYIIALLEQDWANFVLLPDYIPDKSFALDDLSPSDKALLLEKKPWFGDPLIWLKEFGLVNEKMEDYVMRPGTRHEAMPILLNSLKNESGIGRRRTIRLLARHGLNDEGRGVSKINDALWEAMGMPLRRGLSNRALAGLLILFSGGQQDPKLGNQLNLVLDLLETQRPASAAKVIGDINLIDAGTSDDETWEQHESISALLSLIADLLEKLIKEYPDLPLFDPPHWDPDDPRRGRSPRWDSARLDRLHKEQEKAEASIGAIRDFLPETSNVLQQLTRSFRHWMENWDENIDAEPSYNNSLERSWSQRIGLIPVRLHPQHPEAGPWTWEQQPRIEDDAGMDLSKDRGVKRVYKYYIPLILNILWRSQGGRRLKVGKLLEIAIDLMLEVGIVDSEFRTILRNSFSFIYEPQEDLTLDP